MAPAATRAGRVPARSTEFDATLGLRASGPDFPPSFRSRLRAKRSGATSTKLEERSRVGEARRGAKRGGGSRIGSMPGYADLPDDADRILSDEWIGREDGEPVNDGLRHKNPIEWVAMQGWQPSDVERRFFVDAQR